LIITIFFSREILAISHAQKCTQWVYSHGWFRKYKYLHLTSTDISKQNNSTGVSTDQSTEGTTASTDTGVSTGGTSSSTQSWSSWGICAGYKVLFWVSLLEKREKYVEQNIAQIKKQMALGEGGHLAALAYFSLCDESSVDSFSQAMQNNYSKFALIQDNGRLFTQTVDLVISNNNKLKKSCQTVNPKQLTLETLI